jgi:hypothetical protein
MASPIHPQSHFQSSPSQSPYPIPLNYTGHKENIYNNGQLLGVNNGSAQRSNMLSGTLQYSGGLLHSNADSNRLLQNFLTEDGVSPMHSTTAKQYRLTDDD